MSIEQLRVAEASPADDRTAPYTVTVTRQSDDIRSAQRLRHQIFAGEFGAITPGPVGLDADGFDEAGDHVIVTHTPRPGAAPETVATYRLLPPASRSTGLYSETEFDLDRIAGLLPYTVEGGRSCVRADHRNGATMSLLWSAIAQYMMRGGHRYLIGCSSIPLTDGGELAAGVWQDLQVSHRDPRFSCPPRRPWVPGPPPAVVRFPSLLKGYLRLGATVLGPPAHDPLFNCVDLLILLDLQNADQRYLRRFLPATGQPGPLPAPRAALPTVSRRTRGGAP
ncbi:GNAT family N-acetyltransferase [Nakamurella deserti]|uniref:GNAT family N-acetyltransferase n=1 Tax=Nakamurella deserti TaxID=2164074 RepID=UPI000DBE9E5E|nr:GNAT family N-acyltransferase [Nakamurella deserti]